MFIWVCLDYVICMVNIIKDFCKFWINSVENGLSYWKEVIFILILVISKIKVLECVCWWIVEVFINVKILIF